MTGGSPETAATVARFDLTAGDVVGEMGYDDDVDHDLRDAIEAATGTEMVDEDADEVVDAVLLWWRDDDGDLIDMMVDALTLLADDGVIWLLTPKTGREGYVEPSDIAEAARTAGLSQTTTVGGPADWTIARLARGRAPKKR
ncbi:DUF3052 domain-containing protein [Nakamurella lactea]|uniref:DUF3052 domain-containing protein n=1 Tax=Nakamurella lactea TaxID=459515 RepID=UPI00048B4887|nr:DUF3052 domain-containing protein [Nakamurella lactea]